MGKDSPFLLPRELSDFLGLLTAEGYFMAREEEKGSASKDFLQEISRPKIIPVGDLECMGIWHGGKNNKWPIIEIAKAHDVSRYVKQSRASNPNFLPGRIFFNYTSPRIIEGKPELEILSFRDGTSMQLYNPNNGMRPTFDLINDWSRQGRNEKERFNHAQLFHYEDASSSFVNISAN
ncbi:MAG: hypothetical protein Q7R87_03945 [Nanoarchaeota archaeon]|nr:hypothetical protein [Nanoarchaeota archaeon]